MGAPYVECDFHLSADGVPVIIHDATLKRTTDGAGEVRAKTVVKLKRLDAGSWFGAPFKGERLPLLKELFELARGRGDIVIEAKEPSSSLPETPQTLARLAAEFKSVPIIVISVDGLFLRAFKELCPSVETGFLSNLPDGPEAAVAGAVKARCEIISVNFRKWDERLPALAAESGLTIAVWTLNELKDIKAFAAKGVVSITGDFPDRVLKGIEGC